MIKSLTVTNPKGETLKLELTKPEKTGLIIQSISGLGPSSASINSSRMAMLDGALFNSAFVNTRNIVLSLAMMFSPTIEDARLKTYNFFPIKERIRLSVETDRRSVYTYGYVESNEPNIFSQTETTQISILCMDPYFYEDRVITTSFYNVESLFEFPFSNESLEESVIELSRLRQDTRANLIYRGDVKTGAKIIIHAKDPIKNISLYNVGTGEQLTIDTDLIGTITGSTILRGDEIYISTVKGELGVQLLRNGVYYNIIGAVGKDSDFFQLSPGDNVFAYAAEEGEENVVMNFRYSNAYGGV